MIQPRKPQPQMSSEPTLHPSELALIERFRRLKDKQKNFASRIIDLLLANESARPSAKAEHVVIAVNWRAKGTIPIKTIEQCRGIWENPTGQKFEIADPFSNRILGVENVDESGDQF